MRRIIEKIKYWRYLQYLRRTDKDLLETARILRMSQGSCGNTTFMGYPVFFPDSMIYLASQRAIVKEKAYRFIPTCNKFRILDCGANIGLSCIYFLHTYPECTVDAYEPDPSVFSVLEENLKPFMASGRIRLHCAAVWIDNCQVSWETHSSDAGRISERKNATKVNAVRLKDLLNERVEMLKIDIEGSEYTVLNDSRSQLSNAENIFIEYHREVEKEDTLSGLLNILDEAGFRTYIRTEFCSQSPLCQESVQESFDLQLNIWGKRIR